jgi:hypothetical protein
VNGQSRVDLPQSQVGREFLHRPLPLHQVLREAFDRVQVLHSGRVGYGWQGRFMICAFAAGQMPFTS